MNKIILLLGCFAVGNSAYAGIIYENGSAAQLGSSGGNNPFSYQNIFVAMDFTLSGSSYIDGAIFNAYTTEETLPVTGVQIKIYENNSGSVGAELYSDILGINSVQVTGFDGPYTLINYGISLDNWYVDAGTYWLGLQVDPAQWDMHWSIVGPVGLGGMQGDNAGTPSSYTSYDIEHYFQLTGNDSAEVPVTSSITLLGLGLAGLGFSRRKKTV